MAPRVRYDLSVAVTDQTAALLDDLTVAEGDAEVVVGDWVARWCRSQKHPNYLFEPLLPSWAGGTRVLTVSIGVPEWRILTKAAAGAGLTIEDAASTIANKRARFLIETRQRGRLF